MTDRLAVVGAGLAGLVAASRLAKAGRDVVVYDKSRGLGGRMATRRSAFGAFDHGAPSAHLDQSVAAQFVERGAATAWTAGGFVGLPGMSGLVRPLAEGLDIRGGTEIAGLTVARDGIRLTLAGGATEGPFARVIAAIPAPQARRFTTEDPQADAVLAEVGFAAVWTLMAAFEARPDLRDIERPDGALDLVVRDSAKPGRAGETWVAHAARDWTAARLEAAREEVLPALLAEFSDLAEGRLPRPAHVDAHRWRYGRAVRPMGAPYLAVSGGAVLIGGDWALGDRAEHAWISGQAMAEAALA